ncbi:glycosyltransferase family 2 protein [Cyclobacteriaceae bacterium YHN15]|nr:glycosyltransferase family 2 protein [Cyclobacteriaceae bacterium YHN15]
MGEEKKQVHAVVIPVINEGERIQRLLTKMFHLEIHKKADIIIVDGGSTDGSLNQKSLKENGIAFLIKKTGPGKLSSQLRCAYAFALIQGYKGIITIDGNDKDDPKDIPAFIDALDNGFDFVQASRFVKGGIGINTPLSRLLAIKFIHAPFLSFASGFKWTDTTQGFRGYSSRMLLDPKVAPFRDVFSGYELLAYLSYRIPKLGYKCIELPTSRIYPKDEVPTKISWLRGNMDLMAVLLKTVMGKYNPIEN